jgi:hypothetical protein
MATTSHHDAGTDALLADLLHVKRLRNHAPVPANPDIATRLNAIEATQARILTLLEESRRDEVPRNANRIYKIGPHRTTLYLNDFVPQVYLTLISVLQGVVLAVLIDEFPFAFGESNPAIYAYICSSFLIIVAFWYAYLSAVLDGRWPFHIVDTLLFFAAATAQAIGVKHVSTPAYWCGAMAVMCVLIALIYLRQIPLLNGLVQANLLDDPGDVARRFWGVRLYTVFFTLAAGIAVLFARITASNPQNLVAAFAAVAIPIMYMIPAVRGAKGFGIDSLG